MLINEVSNRGQHQQTPPRTFGKVVSLTHQNVYMKSNFLNSTTVQHICLLRSSVRHEQCAQAYYT